MMYLDLAELDTVFRGRWLWSARGFNLAQFRRRDHLGSTTHALDDCVRDLVAVETGQRPAGPIRLLTHLRYCGYAFNPVSFYFCFDATGNKLDAIVAEVSNTPWREQHPYVLPCEAHGQPGQSHTFEFRKVFHVSPFMPMDIDYRWQFRLRGDDLLVHMENLRDGHSIFDATMLLKRHSINSRGLARVLISFPLMTLKVITAIHFEALRLWLKRTPFYTHPAKLTTKES